MRGDSPFCSIGWGEDGEAEAQSVAELDRVLDDLARQHSEQDAVLAEVRRKNGDSLSVGLGHPRSVVSFVPGSGLPPYLISRGDRKDGPGLVFYYFGRWTEFAERNLIEIEDAREAVRHFARTGDLSDLVSWEET